MTTTTVINNKASRLAELMAAEDISLDDASLVLEHLSRKDKAGDESADFQFRFNCHAWDGAVALGKAITKVFGFSFGESTFSLMGEELPQMIEVQTGPKSEDKITMPWGKMTLPGVNGWLRPGLFGDTFAISCSIKRKHEEQVKVLAAEIGRILLEESIYRGRAVRLEWTQQPFEDEVLEPTFMQLAGLDESQLVLNQSVREAVEISLFTPVDQREAVKAAGIEWQRRVLLSGGYGVGKSLTAAIVASKAEAASITFVMCGAENLARAMQFAKNYAPAIVFCEDIDATMIAHRSAEVNSILDELDGVTSKQTDVMVVFTTNSVEYITKAAIRPGRCDAVIEFELPDQRSTETLIRRYAGMALAADVDISSAAAVLAGNSPAVIAEAAKRARLAGIRAGEKAITPALLITAVRTMQGQIELLRKPEVVTPNQLDSAARIVGYYIARGLEVAVADNKVKTVAHSIGNGKEGMATLSAVAPV